MTGISLAVLRLGGFILADASYRGGQITTPPIRFAGRRLELNVDTSGGGSVNFEILNEAQQPLPGFAEGDALPVNGNLVRMPVRWKAGNDVSSLCGQTIRLRFHLRDCKLYAFQFRE